ncbi:hypothetical protein SteCoe_17754 [Stentor coeruleus]|uniref:Arrestin-like N-terminal domain-containing protein n=1 Tax=Stentor coeruleus TaxID=5963 RepID=A0A1R2BY84_9CILI|nr:hypothetical protein SteCoe_17754 [Stentor coeruleus]
MENRVLVYLDTLKICAGSKVTGEICANCNPCLLVLKLSGKEKVQVRSLNNHRETKKVQLFKHVEKIIDIQERSKAVFPFSYKLPSSAPATFHFSKVDQNGSLIDAIVVYKIQALLLQGETVVATDYKFLTVYRMPSGRCKVPSLSFAHTISSCLSWNFVMELDRLSSEDCYRNIAEFKFRCIDWPENFRILEIILRTIYNITIQLPNDFIYKNSFVICETRSTNNETQMELHSETLGRFGDNHGTNDSKLISSEFTFEGIVRASFCCKTWEIKGELPFHVNPVDVKTPKFSSTFENLKAFPIINIILKSNFDAGEEFPSG